MKCHKPNTDQEAWFTVFVNGVESTEYTFPDETNTDASVVECFIPVSGGDKLEIKGQFNGTILHGSWDVVADGTFLGDRRTEAIKGQLKNVRRKVEICEVLDTPKRAGWKGHGAPPIVVEGEMRVRSLKEEPSSDLDGAKFGLGSLALVVNVNQKTEEMYEDKYPGITCGSWKERDDYTGYYGIVPTHEITVKVTDPKLHMNRQSKHKRHWEQLHFGRKPWATFIWHYRSQSAMREAGCIPKESTSQELEPGDADVAFVNRREERRGGNSKNPDSLFVTGTAPAPTMPKKQRLFGQSLSKTSAAVGDTELRRSSIMEDESDGETAMESGSAHPLVSGLRRLAEEQSHNPESDESDGGAAASDAIMNSTNSGESRTAANSTERFYRGLISDRLGAMIPTRAATKDRKGQISDEIHNAPVQVKQERISPELEEMLPTKAAQGSRRSKDVTGDMPGVTRHENARERVVGAAGQDTAIYLTNRKSAVALTSSTGSGSPQIYPEMPVKTNKRSGSPSLDREAKKAALLAKHQRSQQLILEEKQAQAERQSELRSLKEALERREMERLERMEADDDAEIAELRFAREREEAELAEARAAMGW